MHYERADAVVLLDDVIRLRKSIRAFRPETVARHLLVEIIETARALGSQTVWRGLAGIPQG